MMEKANYIATKLYYTNLILLILKIYYSVSDIITIPNILSKAITFFVIASFICILLIKTLSQRFTKKQSIIYYSILAICFFTSIIAKDFNIVLSYLLVVCIKDIDLKNVLKVILGINIVMILMHISGYVLNLIFKFKDVVVYYTDAGSVRHNFWMGNPNHFAIILFWTYATYIYLKFENINYKDYALGIILSIFSYISPQSKTIAIATVIFVGLIIASKLNIEKINQVIRFGSKYLFIIFIIFTIVVIVPYRFFYDKITVITDIIDQIDVVLSGRILYPHAVYKKHGFTIIGEFVDYNEIQEWNGPFIMDNLYGKILFNYGCFYAILLTYLLIAKSKKFEDKEHIYVIIFSVMAICEVHVLNACIGITLLMIGDIVQNREGKDEQIN